MGTRRTFLTDGERRELVRLYRDRKLSLRACQKHFRRGQAAIRRDLIEAGVEPAPRGHNRKPRRSAKLSLVQIRLAHHEYITTSATIKDIAAKYGIHHVNMSRTFTRLKLPRKPRGWTMNREPWTLERAERIIPELAYKREQAKRDSEARAATLAVVRYDLARRYRRLENDGVPPERIRELLTL